MEYETRLGRVERAVLNAVIRRDGLTLREEVVHEAFPELGERPQSPAAAGRRWQQRRARAEAAVSRAILSLERKNLLWRERNQRTGRTLLRAHATAALPEWEQIARGEEDLAAHCRKTAAAWSELAVRATRRAAVVRDERGTSSTEAERRRDIDAVAGLEPSGRRR